MTSEVEPEPRQKYRPSRWSHVALCKASARRGPAKIAARFETAVFGKTFALLGMVFAVSSALCLSCCGSDEEDTRETLRGSRTSPGGKYTVEDWRLLPRSAAKSH